MIVKHIIKITLIPLQTDTLAKILKLMEKRSHTMTIHLIGALLLNPLGSFENVKNGFH